jgi:hypothetical protein
VAKPAEIQPVTASSKVVMGLYGPPGAGKTRLLGEAGKGTLILRPPMDHMDSIRTAGADQWIIYDHAELLNASEYCRHDAAKDYDWVWFDSVSLWQDMGLDDIWSGVIAEKPHRAKYSLDKGEYNVNMWRLQTWFRQMVGIPGFNFGWTAHQMEMENPLTGEFKYQPYVQGKNMSQKFQGYCNIVGYLEVVHQDGKEPRRVLRTQGTEQYEAKDQFDAFPNGRLVDPTMPKIMAAIESAQKKRASTSTSGTARRRPSARTRQRVARR